jgi:hypothetical protein
LDGTAWRLLRFKPLAEVFQFCPRAFNHDKNTLRRVVDPAGQPKIVREPMNKRTKADALHRTAKSQPEARGICNGLGFGDGHIYGRTGAFQLSPASQLNLASNKQRLFPLIGNNCPTIVNTGKAALRSVCEFKEEEQLCMKFPSWRKRCGWP